MLLRPLSGCYGCGRLALRTCRFLFPMCAGVGPYVCLYLRTHASHSWQHVARAEVMESYSANFAYLVTDKVHRTAKFLSAMRQRCILCRSLRCHIHSLTPQSLHSRISHWQHMHTGGSEGEPQRELCLPGHRQGPPHCQVPLGRLQRRAGLTVFCSLTCFSSLAQHAQAKPLRELRLRRVLFTHTDLSSDNTCTGGSEGEPQRELCVPGYGQGSPHR